MMVAYAEETEAVSAIRRSTFRNVHSEQKRIEKLRYIHRNPVVRGLVACPEDWKWSSFRHYATGLEGTVEIESFWTRREEAACLTAFDSVARVNPTSLRDMGTQI